MVWILVLNFSFFLILLTEQIQGSWKHARWGLVFSSECGASWARSPDRFCFNRALESGTACWTGHGALPPPLRAVVLSTCNWGRLCACRSLVFWQVLLLGLSKVYSSEANLNSLKSHQHYSDPFQNSPSRKKGLNSHFCSETDLRGQYLKLFQYDLSRSSKFSISHFFHHLGWLVIIIGCR